MPRFLVATTGHSVPLSGGETYVGTDPTVQIPVRADMGLLPRHFVIAPSAGGWQLAAFDGAMVLVNGLQVRNTEIHDGDQIVAGQLALTYRDEQEAAMAKAMPNVMQAPQTQMTSTPQPVQAPPALSLAIPTLTLNAFPSLQTGLPRSEEEPERLLMDRPREIKPEAAPPPRVIYRTELGDITSMAGGQVGSPVDDFDRLGHDRDRWLDHETGLHGLVRPLEGGGHCHQRRLDHRRHSDGSEGEQGRGTAHQPAPPASHCAARRFELHASLEQSGQCGENWFREGCLRK